jgi:hypothetical protein
MALGAAVGIRNALGEKAVLVATVVRSEESLPVLLVQDSRFPFNETQGLLAVRHSTTDEPADKKGCGHNQCQRQNG